MLMKHGRAYSSSCLQDVLVYIHSFHQKSLFCSRKSRIKTTKSSYSRFKIIDVIITKKQVSSACYDKQHACAYLQPLACWTSQYQKNDHFLGGTPL